MDHTNNNNNNDDNDDDDEAKRFNESLNDIERSVSLCTLCKEETNLQSQRSTIFVPSLPLIEESKSYGNESEITNLVVESEESYNYAEMFDKPQSGSIQITFRHEETRSVFDLTKATCAPIETPIIHEDEVSKLFIEYLQKCMKPSDIECRVEDSCETTKQLLSLGQPKMPNNFVINEIVSPTNNVFFEEEAGIVNINGISVNKVYDRIPNDNYRNDCSSHVVKISSSQLHYEIDVHRRCGDEKIHFADDKNINEASVEIDRDYTVEAPCIYHSGVLDNEIPRKKASSQLHYEIDAHRRCGDEKIHFADDNKINEASVEIARDYTVEAPRIYHSDILDNEIPRKRVKILEDERPVSSLVSTSLKKYVERKRVNCSEPRPAITEEEDVLRKRPKIVEINLLNKSTILLSREPRDSTPNDFPDLASMDNDITVVKQVDADELASNKDSAAVRNTIKTEYPGIMMHSRVMEKYSTDVSPEIPIVSELRKLKEIQKPRVDINANNNSVARKETTNLRNTEGGYGKEMEGSKAKKKYSIIDSPEIPIAAELTKIRKFRMPQANIETNNELASCEESANTQNEKSRFAVKTKVSKPTKKYPNKPYDGTNVISPRKQRRLSDTWSEVEKAFTNSKGKIPLPCRKNKLAISPPNVKRLKTKITTQHKCMNDTLTRIKNLSSYMDQVRDTILAEDDCEKEYTLVNNNETSLGPKTKIIVSVGTQTIDSALNSFPPAQHQPQLTSLVEPSTIRMLAVGTQTEDNATNLPDKTGITIEKNELKVKNSNDNPLLGEKASKRQNKRLLAIDEATARSQSAIFNATFEEFRRKKRN